MKIKQILLPVLLLSAIIGLWQLSVRLSASPTPPFPSSPSTTRLLTPTEFAAKIKEPGVFVLDVHTPTQTHIPGTHLGVPFDQLVSRQSELPKDKSEPILVYCRSGGMSAEASLTLAGLGYTNVYDLAGGTDAYKEQEVSVSLTPSTTNLGTVIYGEVANTTLTFTNYTPLPTRITRLSTSCGCTKAEAVKTELGPYESTSILVSFDPAVHKDDTDLGDLTRTIYLETDNPNFPSFESQLTATVIKKD